MKTFGPFTVDAIPPDEQIVARTVTSEIVVYENNQAGTADVLLRAPSSADAQVTRPAGQRISLKPQSGGLVFTPGEVVATVSVGVGSIQMVQEEM